MRTTQVVALPPGLPLDVVDEILTATEAALLRHGADRIRLDTSQHGLVVLADLPTTPTAAEAPVAEMEMPAQRSLPSAASRAVVETEA